MNTAVCVSTWARVLIALFDERDSAHTRGKASEAYYNLIMLDE